MDNLLFLPESALPAESSGNGTIVLATVSAVDTDHGLTLIFDGDAAASQKKYKMLMNGNTPAVGDRVAAIKHSGTYIVLGAIGTNGGGGGGGGDVAAPNTVYAGPASGTEPGEAAFRQLVAEDLDLSGAGFVEKEGDEMTGLLGMVSPDLHESSPPSSGTRGVGIEFLDADGNVMGRLVPEMWSDGSMTMTLQALVSSAGTRLHNWISITQRKNGDSEMSIGSPIPLYQGGTGTRTYDYAYSGIITAATGFTCSSQTIRGWGRLMMLNVSFRKSAAQTVTNFTEIGTLESAYRPMTQSAAMTSDGRFAYILGDGKVYVQGPFTTSSFSVYATYMK